MPKINQEEYEISKELDDKWKWIARDSLNNSVYVYLGKPNKYTTYWEDEEMIFEQIDESLFQFIQWEDEEPYEIAELIEEYEREAKDKGIDLYTRRMKYIAQAFSNLNSESEETEVKDLEWLKSWFKNEKVHYQGKYINSKINQLDEPEVLSQEFIDEHKQHIAGLSADENSVDQYHNAPFVSVYDLQNLLVPKQEEITEEQAWEVIHGKYGDEVLQNNIDYVESQGYVVIEKPTIPQFVAEWIEKYGGNYKPSFLALGYDLYSNNITYPEVDKWIADNQETFARAWLDGYEVEEKQKYYVEDGKHTLLCKWESSDGWKVISTIEATEDDLPIEVLDFELTEQEIKGYDERYWPFAVKVEELEE